MIFARQNKQNIIKGNMSIRLYYGHRRDSTFFVFTTEIQVLLQFLSIDVIVTHDLQEVFKFFDEFVLVTRYPEILRQVIKRSTSGG